MATISCVTSVYNSEKYLPRMLKSVKWVDEIIVVDNNSTDNTAKIAREYAAKIFVRPNNPMLNLNKNFGFEQASSDWILNLDGDEEITPDLKNEINEIINSNSDINGYWIPRQNIIFGKWIKHGIWWPDKQLRLFKRNKGVFPGKHIHEYISVDGLVGDLITPFVHYNYESISQFIYKLDSLYTKNEVENLIASGYQPIWQDAIKFPVSDFIKIYFAQSGYLDGLHGLVLAMLQGFYSFVVFAKLWEKAGFKDHEIDLLRINHEIKQAGSDIRYWQKTAEISRTNNLLWRIYLKIGRRIGL
jgi:glycosyltransferase involved in cell wall biosynthesis